LGSDENNFTTTFSSCWKSNKSFTTAFIKFGGSA
jgi:hypothetical protein